MTWLISIGLDDLRTIPLDFLSLRRRAPTLSLLTSAGQRPRMFCLRPLPSWMSRGVRCLSRRASSIYRIYHSGILFGTIIPCEWVPTPISVCSGSSPRSNKRPRCNWSLFSYALHSSSISINVVMKSPRDALACMLKKVKCTSSLLCNCIAPPSTTVGIFYVDSANPSTSGCIAHAA